MYLTKRLPRSKRVCRYRSSMAAEHSPQKPAIRASIPLRHDVFRTYKRLNEFLDLLGQRYPLKSASYNASDGETLLITVAVHEDLARRTSRGKQSTHIPTVPEFAVEAVKKGFWQLSKIHHPDQRGENEAQRRLIEARDCLNRLCENITGDRPTDVVWIPEPPQQPKRTPRPQEAAQ